MAPTSAGVYEGGREIVKKWVRALALGAMTVSLSGCAGEIAGSVAGKLVEKLFEPAPTRIEATIQATQDINPDYDGQASPLVIRLYELKSATAFNNAAFFALYDGDLAELGDDMQNREEIELKPGQAVEVARDLKPETRFIGIMAAYRDIDNATWRAVQPIEENETAELTITVQRLNVSIAETE
jgi:type VI secretion system protein VasD